MLSEQSSAFLDSFFGFFRKIKGLLRISLQNTISLLFHTLVWPVTVWVIGKIFLAFVAGSFSWTFCTIKESIQDTIEILHLTGLWQVDYMMISDSWLATRKMFNPFAMELFMELESMMYSAKSSLFATLPFERMIAFTICKF